MSRLHEPVLQLIISALKQRLLLESIERIVLFGSRARGDADERSDIDLAIVGSKISKRQWLDIVSVLDEIDTLLTIDAVHFEKSSQVLKDNILREGVVVYEQHKKPTES